jgi:predicted hotdog family 3-hydroxylacyl-ACP dehydratase
MNFPPVEELLPHEGIMVLIDEILDFDSNFIASRVDIRNQKLFKNHLGAVYSWVGIE